MKVLDETEFLSLYHAAPVFWTARIRCRENLHFLTHQIPPAMPMKRPLSFLPWSYTLLRGVAIPSTSWVNHVSLSLASPNGQADIWVLEEFNTTSASHCPDTGAPYLRLFAFSRSIRYEDMARSTCLSSCSCQAVWLLIGSCDIRIWCLRFFHNSGKTERWASSKPVDHPRATPNRLCFANRASLLKDTS